MTDQEQQSLLAETKQLNDEQAPEVSNGRPQRTRIKRGNKFAAAIPKKSARLQKSVEKFSNEPRAKWTVTEKTKLLEGIRRFSTDNTEILASMVKSKTQEEVAEYIEQLKKTESKRKNNQDTTGDKKSPIELWTELVAEMVFYEDMDYSEFIPKVFGLIARNEKFAPSNVPRLSWGKIYEFISDLLNDKAELTELTDVESHVILDLMQGLGDTLRACDTGIQQRLLTTKYNLLNTKTENLTIAGRQHRLTQIYRGLTNNFEYMEDQDTASNAPGTSKSGSTSGKLSSTCSDNTSSSSPSSMTELKKEVELNTLFKENDALSSRPVPGEDVSNDDDGEDVAEMDMTKPKLYTLNPLCIPTALLPLKPKDK